MANKMLIDASHPEETRVVVLRGNRVEEFDFESASKKQLRGNIYLAKVTRVEPSLQAAFVDYGGNRHGFLAFSEIHPDYYQIPVADRQALMESEAATDQDEEDEEQKRERRSRRFRRGDRNGQRAEKRRNEDDVLAGSPLEHPGAPDLERPAEQSISSIAIDRLGFAKAYPQDHAALERPHAGNFQNPVPVEPGPVSELTVQIENLESEGLGASEQIFPQQESEAGQTHVSAEAVPDETAGSSTPDFIPQFGGLDPEEPAHQAGDENGKASVYEPNGSLQRLDLEVRSHSLNGLSGSDETDQFSPSLADESERPFSDHGLDGEDDGPEDEADQVEQLGGDAMEEVPIRAHHFRKQYKIQEVIKRRQILLIQVVKEERGNKGAALTTYLSLAGRYSVLMPNTARGGGISRKITDVTDRQRLKSIAQELEVPEGMGVILRTAGASRTMAEVKRDFEYLLRMWETVREMTLQSTAPMLVYEEGSLIKRSIRDLFNKDIDEILVSGENAYREARDFMRLLMPSHVKNVIPYLDPQPIFAKSGAEAQLDAMYGNQVTMKSGGSIVINQTEALVAIDVNSGRSTREHNIEDTALRTNLEACDEIARQLRLRDLAGLIVVDFIDMEESRNNRAVERRMKDALKNDRARIQVGHISHFGLLEMSRQRIRTGVLEGSTLICPHCAGAGMVRSTSSVALHVLRVLEDAMIKNPGYEFIVKTRTPVALYILNQKRANLRDLEERFGVPVIIATDDTLTGTTYHALERGELVADPREILSRVEPPRIPSPELIEAFLPDETEEDPDAESDLIDDNVSEEAEASDADAKGEGDNGNKRRRRRRRRGGSRGGDREGVGIAANAPQPSDEGLSIFASSLRAPMAETIEPYQPSLEPARHIETPGPDEAGEPPELQASQASWGLESGAEERALSPDEENLNSEASLEEHLIAEGNLQSGMTGESRASPAEEFSQEDVSAKDEIAQEEIPQRKRSRRSPRNASSEVSAGLAEAVESQGSSAEAKSRDGEEEPRRRPRRPARARSPRRGIESETGSELTQVELGLMEHLPSQPQPVNIPLDRDDAAQQMLGETRLEGQSLSRQAESQRPSNHTAPADESAASSESLTSEAPASAGSQPNSDKHPETKQPEPPQPKRSGWWQRAKASIRG